MRASKTGSNHTKWYVRKIDLFKVRQERGNSGSCISIDGFIINVC